MTDSADDASFIAAVASTVTTLERLADAYLAATKDRRNPAAESTAMRELAAEHRFRFGPWDEPVVSARSAAAFLAFAGVDHLRAYAHLFASPPVPVYAHLPTARAAIEAFAWARWMGDPEIPPETGVKRDQLHQLEDAKQRQRFPGPGMKEMGKEIAGRVRAGADAAGWRVVANTIKNEPRISIGKEPLPRPVEVIASVTGTGGTVAQELGATLWAYLSPAPPTPPATPSG